MATSIVKHDWNGHQIRQKATDGYVNLTDMCKSEGRVVFDYLRLPSTIAYIDALADDLNILRENLVVTKEGRGGGTYAHPEIAIDCAQWISMPFRIWANRTLKILVQYSEVSSVAHPMLAWAKIRLTGKDVRREFTDAVKEYIDRHPELSMNAITFMYPNASDLINLTVFGRKAKKLAEDWKCDRSTIRDNMTPRELQWITEVEDLAARLIDQDEINPCEAVKIARQRLAIEVVTR